MKVGRATSDVSSHLMLSSGIARASIRARLCALRYLVSRAALDHFAPKPVMTDAADVGVWIWCSQANSFRLSLYRNFGTQYITFQFTFCQISLFTDYQTMYMEIFLDHASPSVTSSSSPTNPNLHHDVIRRRGHRAPGCDVCDAQCGNRSFSLVGRHQALEHRSLCTTSV